VLAQVHLTQRRGDEMAVGLTSIPKHEDDLIACQNYRLWQGMWSGWTVAGVLAIVLGMQSLRTQPLYVFRDGAVVKLEPVTRVEELPDVIVRQELKQFIEAAYAVSPVWDEEQERLARLRAMLVGQAATALAVWYKDGNDPLQVEKSAWVAVHDVHIFKGPATNEYDATWTATRHALSDGSTTTTRWKALIGTTTMKKSTVNEFGVGVRYLDPSQE
jgi:VirB8 protein